jgi:hypothetical protein
VKVQVSRFLYEGNIVAAILNVERLILTDAKESGPQFLRFVVAECRRKIRRLKFISWTLFPSIKSV